MPIPVHPTKPADSESITLAELALATRNHGMPLEAMRWDLTPTGMHYVLVHYDVPVVDASEWRLEIRDTVNETSSFSLEDLRSMPTATLTTTMECAGNGRALLQPRALSQPWLLEAIGTAEWTGVPLVDLIDACRFDDDTVEYVFTGADRGLEAGVVQNYERAITIDEARTSGALVAFLMNGEPLPPQHGYPVRLIVPGWYGMTNVKWLTRISAVAQPFGGYQNSSAYRLRQEPEEPGTPLTRMMPRSLIVPPGIPDFFSRQRLLSMGDCLLEGRAWSGWAPIESVDVSVDGGERWAEADLESPRRDPHAWRRFTFPWSPPAEGDYDLSSRCRDAEGNPQPGTPTWNLGGYANNAIQRVRVTVTTTL